MAFEVIQGEGIPEFKVPLSAATRAGDFVYVSGQASVDESGQIVSDTFEAEMHRSIGNVRRILQAAGLDLSDVVRVGCYVRNPEDLGKFNEIYREYFSEPFPARTTIVQCLPDIIRFEIDVVAYAGK